MSWFAQLSSRDQRLLKRLMMFWAVALLALGVYYYWPAGDGAVVSASTDSVDVAEQRLDRLRRLAAAVPAKQDVLKQVTAELALREKGLIRADTGAQAQAQLVQILRQLGSQEDPHIDVHGIQFGPLAPLAEGSRYGIANLTIQVECRIEQLINFLSAIAARPELIYPQNIEISASNPKEKTLRVMLSVNGVVAKELVAKPGADKGGARKGAGAF